MPASCSGSQALHILGTPLKSLELTSLKRIANGNVYVLANDYLCYVSTIDWKELFPPGSKQRANIMSNGNKANCGKFPSLFFLSIGLC